MLDLSFKTCSHLQPEGGHYAGGSERQVSKETFVLALVIIAFLYVALIIGGSAW